MTELLAGYPPATGRALAKEIDHIDRHCRAFIELAPFAVLATSGPGGEPDVSPRGGAPGFVRVLDEHRLLVPDRPGNNRLDSLRKIAGNPQVALLFMVPGIDETLRVYGTAELISADASPVPVTEHGREPRSVLAVQVSKAFFQCAKALMRSALWDPASRVERDVFPTMGTVMRDHALTTGPVESQADMVRRYTDLL